MFQVDCSDWDVCTTNKTNNFVIPAKAGIQLFQSFLDTGFRRYDDFYADPPLVLQILWSKISTANPKIPFRYLTFD